MGLCFVRVDVGNYFRFKRFLVCNEKFFEPKVRTPIREYDKIICDDSMVCLLLFNHNFVGHIIGYADSCDVFYLSSFLVVPRFRGKGYGDLLLDRFLCVLRRSGYKFVDGHFNKYSLKLFVNKNVIRVGRVYKGYSFVRISL